jgi:twinkle protein
MNEGLLDPVDMIEEALGIYAQGGLRRGDSTGWPSVDEFYTVAPAQWTVITGVPSSGKSEWLDAMLVNLSQKSGWEFAIYSPENYPPSTHLIKLAEKESGKPFNAGPTERMTREQFKLSATHLCSSMFWMEPTLKTPDELIRTGLAYRQSGRKFGIVLDPWNTLEHQRGTMSETDYVSFILTEVTKLVRAANAHVWLVVHPTKVHKDKNGVRPIPTPYDISGSAHWYNKADNIITVHRDMTQQTQDVEIHVQKIRFKHIGKQGMATLKWDKVTGRYFEAPTNVIYDTFTRQPEKYAHP